MEEAKPEGSRAGGFGVSASVTGLRSETDPTDMKHRLDTNAASLPGDPSVVGEHRAQTGLASNPSSTTF